MRLRNGPEREGVLHYCRNSGSKHTDRGRCLQQPEYFSGMIKRNYLGMLVGCPRHKPCHEELGKAALLSNPTREGPGTTRSTLQG